MLNNNSWLMTLVELASNDCIASRAAIRALYVEGFEVTWIAETCMLPMAVVQDALNRIP